MTQPLVFTDLDDTLFQTARKMPGAPDPARLAARAGNGRHSYMTSEQEALVRWLLDSTELVPVTARSTEALSRCSIRFQSWRIAANGAVMIAPDGTVEPEWQERTARISERSRDALGEMESAVAAVNRDGRLRHWIIVEDARPIYLCVKSNGDEGWLSEAEAVLAPQVLGDMVLRRNGNNLTVGPAEISKEAAVRALSERIGAGRPMIGVGDSLSDLGFMSGCTMMMMPPGSQIAGAIE